MLADELVLLLLLLLLQGRVTVAVPPKQVPPAVTVTVAVGEQIELEPEETTAVTVTVLVTVLVTVVVVDAALLVEDETAEVLVEEVGAELLAPLPGTFNWEPMIRKSQLTPWLAFFKSSKEQLKLREMESQVSPDLTVWVEDALLAELVWLAVEVVVFKSSYVSPEEIVALRPRVWFVHCTSSHLPLNFSGNL